MSSTELIRNRRRRIRASRLVQRKLANPTRTTFDRVNTQPTNPDAYPTRLTGLS